MARNPDLIRTILDRRSGETAALVYADWLDENDDPKHAELIRVQCELAQKTCAGNRRTALAKREAELLSDPGFHLPGRKPFRYKRGFIAEACTLTLTGKVARLDTFLMASLTDRPEDTSGDLTLTDLPVLDRALNLTLNLGGLPTKKLKWDDPLVAGCLQRVIHLECPEDETVEPAAVKYLLKCPHLGGVTSITFDKAGEVPLDLVSALFLSPALPNVDAIHLDGEEWIAEDGSPVEDEHIAAFVTRLGASEKAAQLTYLQLNWVIGPKTAQAILDAQHLKPSDQLCLFMHRGLKKPVLDALKKRFGKALHM
jgi:uncharacterized protein (TIGR02996 family)